MGHSYTAVGGLGDFTVAKSNPSGAIVRFTVSDAAGKLTSPKMIRSVLCDAITQWIALERADLNTNGDSDVVGATDNYPGDGFDQFSFNFESKYAEVTLTATTNISTTGNITASIPYADVV